MVGNLGRVSTFGMNDTNLGNILQSQRQITDLSAQISSGKRARRYEGLADQSSRLVNIENELERVLQYKQNNADVERRLNGMESSLASIIEMGIDLKADLVLASNPGNQDDTPLAQLGAAFYEQSQAFLNLEQDNRYLFGGTRTDRPPVQSLEEVSAAIRAQSTGVGATNQIDFANLAGKDTVVLDNDENASVPLRTLQIIDFFLNDEETGTNTAGAAGTDNYPQEASDGYTTGGLNGGGPGGLVEDFRTNSNPLSFREAYYRGDQFQLSSKIEDNIDLEYGVKADRKGLEKAMLAGWLLANVDSPVPIGTGGEVLDREDTVEVALKLMEDALQDMGEDSLSAIRSDVGVDLQRVEDSQQRYNQFEVFHEEVQTEIENTDIATAATALSQTQLILESSFLAISSISQLSLANFLR